jgi:uncharacterized phage protein (predicted DNA packaging)
MIIQTLKDIEFPGGSRVRAGAVLSVPDAVGAALIEQGAARLRNLPGPMEKKVDPTLNPGDPLPPQVPFVRVPTDPFPARAFEPGGYEDQDNFITNQVTLRAMFDSTSAWDWANQQDASSPPPPVTPSPSAESRPPVLMLDEIKLQCKIEPDQTADDTLLEQYEMAARLHTENYLRYQIDDAMGENIKQAMLMLIAHWYRNREAVTTGKTSVGVEMPLAYQVLLSGERDYPIY